MKTDNEFIGDDFLLDTETAYELYNRYARDLPLIDYHCHINPQEIFEDKKYSNITQLWLGVGGSHFGDHYKWRLMRSMGVEEDYITGTKPDEERFVRWAECLERAIGNPLYHWSHLELKKYFGFTGTLNAKNARDVYALCNKKLKSPEMSVRGIIRQSNVKVICTTDDPADSLIWHKKLSEDKEFETKVYPAMRPDKAKDIEKESYTEYLEKLGNAAGIKIQSFIDLKEALKKRMDYFEEMGCRISDHALDTVLYVGAEESNIEKIFSKRLSGETLTRQECEKFYTAFMLFVGAEYARRNWVMQIHFGCKRNNNTKTFEKMGPDTGYDCIGTSSPAAELADLLNALAEKEALPRTILYSLNPNDDAMIDSVIGCFQDSSAYGKLQHGSAWWFNDHFDGMTKHLKSLANLGALSTFVGMLTDSRSFLSYTRHDYFRRILCRLFGRWVEDGWYPHDMDTLKELVQRISYYNAAEYFGFESTRR